jgi:hypothetical protein
LVIMEFWTQDQVFISRWSTSSVTYLAAFLLVICEIGFLLPGWPGHDSPVCASLRSLYDMYVPPYHHWLRNWHQTMILPISASQVARITGMSHHTQPSSAILPLLFIPVSNFTWPL